MRRKDATDKKQELRKLVGYRQCLGVSASNSCSNRYRDLIDSADSIVDMKRAADGLVSSITRMEEESGKLSRKGPSGSSKAVATNAKEAERASRKLVLWALSASS